MYFIVALSMIVFSVMAVTTRKILRAATYLLFTLFAGAVVYFMLDYEFLGAVQIAVYAGGIVVLFVFAILLTSRPGDNSERLTSKSRVLGAVAAIATLVITGYALISRVSVALAPKPETCSSWALPSWVRATASICCPSRPYRFCCSHV